MNDQQTIREARDFLELGRDEQDRTAVVTQAHKLTMNKLDGANIDTARRLRHEQQFRCDVIFTTDDQLLLVATRKRARRQCGIWRTNVKVLNDLRGASLHGVLVQENSSGVSRDRRAIVNAKDRVFSETEVE